MRRAALINKGASLGLGLLLGGKTVGEQLERSLKELCSSVYAFLDDGGSRVYLLDGLLRAVKKAVLGLDLSSYEKVKRRIAKDLLVLAGAVTQEVVAQVRQGASRSMGAQICAAGFLAMLDSISGDAAYKTILEYELRTVFRHAVDWVFKQQWLSSTKTLDVDQAERWGVHLEPEAALRHGVRLYRRHRSQSRG